MELLRDYWVLTLPLAALLWSLLARLSAKRHQFPYGQRPAIMTNNERAFYRALRRATDEAFDVFAMVRIADLLVVRSGSAKRQSWQNRINCKHIDFVLCDPEDLQPLLAIEVDDRSHLSVSRRERDHFVDRAFDAAGLPLMRVQASRRYSAKELKAAISHELSRDRSRKLPSERRVQVG